MTVVCTVKLKAIRGLDTLPARSGTTYARAKIARRWLGRSSPIPGGATELDLTKERAPWEHRVRAQSGGISLRIEIWEDRGDDAPRKLRSADLSIEAPLLDGSRTLSKEGLEVELELAVVIPTRSEKTAAVPRVVDGSKTVGTLRVRDVLEVEITKIEGLFKADKTAEDGYTSDDDKGRAYTNRKSDGTWAHDGQFLVIHAKVNVLSGRLPPGAKMLFTAVDPDDPTDDNPNFHRQWGREVDPLDYDTDGNPLGAAGGDNQGGTGRFEAIAPYGASGSNPARCAIVKNECQVKLKTTRFAGDGFVVHVGIEAKGAIVLEADTGRITMWHRLDVEHLKMEGSPDLPIDPVIHAYEHACVQLDFAPVREIPYHSPIGITDAQFAQVVDSWAHGVLQKRGQKGWLGVIGARLPWAPPQKPAEPAGGWPRGKVKLTRIGSGDQTVVRFDLPGEHWKTNAVDFEWKDAQGRKAVAGFSVTSQVLKQGPDGPPFTRCEIGPDQTKHYHPRFTAGDGSLTHAESFKERHWPHGFVRDGTFSTSGGYEVPDEVEAVLKQVVQFTGGIATATIIGGVEHFDGGAIVFTQHPRFVTSPTDWMDASPVVPNGQWQSTMAQYLAHELLHAFGFPHICGHWDHRTPRAHSCAANYAGNWVFDESLDLTPGTQGKEAVHFCGRHLAELRKVDFSKMAALKW